MPDLSIDQLSEIIGGQLSLGTMPSLGRGLDPVGRIVTDSQRVQPGDVFWGLETNHNESMQFALEAMFRAAQGTIVGGRQMEPWAGCFHIQVPDARLALQKLARFVRRRFVGRVIGIAGLPYRHVTASLVHQLLQASLSGSCNDEPVCEASDLAVTMLNWSHESDYAVVDMGAAESQKIAEISHLCCPEIIAINSPHKITHHQLSRDRKAFAEINERFLCTLPRNATVIINGDDFALREAAESNSIETISVGCSCDTDVTATNVSYRDDRLQFDVEHTRFQFRFRGRHFLTSALTAIAIGRLLSVPLDVLQSAAQKIIRPLRNGRAAA